MEIYRKQPSVGFSDFMNYYSDAKAIGFSDKKAMRYAWNCCWEDLNEDNKTLKLFA